MLIFLIRKRHKLKSWRVALNDITGRPTVGAVVLHCSGVAEQTT